MLIILSNIFFAILFHIATIQYKPYFISFFLSQQYKPSAISNITCILKRHMKEIASFKSVKASTHLSPTRTAAVN